MPEKDHTSVGGEVRQLWEKGYDTLEKKNFDYAMVLLAEAVEKEPAFFDCRMALRAAQMKKHENAGRLGKIAAAAGNAHHLAQAKIAIGRKNYFKALAHAEKILCGNPENSTAHRVIVNAAQALDLPQTMISSLQMLKKANPKDNKITQELAQALEMLNDWDEAERVMLQLAQMNPEDPFLQQAYKDTAAKATIYRGNYEKREGGQGVDEVDDSIADYSSEDVLDEKIYNMEERLQDEPENYKLAVDIAKLYVERQDFDRAFEYFDFVRTNHSVSDSSIDRALADAEEARFNYDINQYPEGSPERVGLEAERDKFMLENCRERADRYPTMLEFRFELGERLFRSGDVNEAIQTFQRAQNSPSHKHRSLCYLGQCFMQREMYDMALSQFEKAMEGKSTFDDQRKELVYNIASVYEKQGKHERAASQYKSIYEMDIGYRDVAEKVEGGYSTGT
tara:strand:- start:448 stop:1800 length:1353 start_codon:yes stop_codon:yes gene_type:complete